MTTQFYDPAIPIADMSEGRRKIGLAPFGWYSRYMLRGYAQYVFMVTAGLVIIALSLDLSRNFAKIAATASDTTGLSTAGRLGYYALLRSVDHITYMFPLGCFLGVLWFEAVLTFTGQRVMIWNTGRSPAQCLVPVLVLLVGVGTIEYILETRLRPMAVQALASARLGDYGERFARTPSTARHWIAAGRDLVHARIEYGPPPMLQDVMIYRHGIEGNLTEVISARTASPGAEPNQWLLRNSRSWFAPEETGTRQAAPPQPSGAESHANDQHVIRERWITLTVDPLWLSNYRIYAKFLPQSVLESLATEAGGRYAATDYLTWLHFRNAQILYPGSMALLAACLSLLFFAQGGSIVGALGIGFAGYVAYVSAKACLLLGEHAYLSPVVAAWFTPVAIIFASMIVLGIVSWRNAPLGRRA